MGEIFVKPNVAEVDFGTAAEADFNAACDLALDTLIPTSPTAGSINTLIRATKTTIGKVYYCDWDSGSDTANTGLSWTSPYKSITKALTVAVDYDTIYVKQGVYLEGATLNITQNGLRLLGVMTSGHQWGQPSIHTHGTETLVVVKANQVEIAYLGFHDQGAGVSLEIGDADGAWWRTHIHDCYFGGNGSALWALVLGNTTNPASGAGSGTTIDAPCTVVERCYFNFYVTANIFMNCGYGSVVRNCVLEVGTAAHGIRYYTDGASRPFGYILDNRFTTLDATNAVAINVAQTPTAGYLVIDGNHFINFADSTTHCASRRSGYMGLNYSGITAVAVT